MNSASDTLGQTRGTIEDAPPPEVVAAPPYDVRAIAREEFEKIAKIPIELSTFEEVWTRLAIEEREAKHHALVGQCTEAEFRRFWRNIAFAGRGIDLTSAGEQAMSTADSHKRAFTLDTDDRFGPTKGIRIFNSHTGEISECQCSPATQLPDFIRDLLSNLRPRG